uniref:Uncharacterized protein n=1 Tax=Tanacetum cinerariifolium TaxID=118510 RepID=A0A699IMH0_TANCI|nr:hypothetical protein [Tanacetum cinerariifolium]
MLGKKLGSFKNLAKMIKVKRAPDSDPLHHDHLLKMYAENGYNEAFPISTPNGYFAIYVEKAYDDEEWNSRLIIPCNVVAFVKVVKIVEYCNGMFDLWAFL